MERVDLVSLILEACAPIEGTRILDIGCGGGSLARRLSDAGARVVGVDLSETILEAARLAAPRVEFKLAAAESLPFEDAVFDRAVFLNALHHVEPDGMDEALREAARVVRPRGRIVVVEPVAAGPFFTVLRIIEDETLVRQQAQEAIQRLIGRGELRLERRLDYDRSELFASLTAFVARIVGVSPARSAAIAAHEDELAALFRKHSTPGRDGGRILIQPLTAAILSRGGF